MTKRELLARLVHEPIVIEPRAAAGYDRIALHADGGNGVWITLASFMPVSVAEGCEAAYAYVDERWLHLTGAEVESLVSRLREFFAIART